ncbi:MAG: hypothetical protein ACRDJB_09735 [Actinomycetota bacterium]
MSLAGRRRLTVPRLLLVVGLLSCACSTTSTRGSPGVRPSLEFTNGGECAPFPTPDLPRDAGCVTTVRGDVDGDGAGDALTVYARTDEGGARMGASFSCGPRPTTFATLAGTPRLECSGSKGA